MGVVTEKSGNENPYIGFLLSRIREYDFAVDADRNWICRELKPRQTEYSMRRMNKHHVKLILRRDLANRFTFLTNKASNKITEMFMVAVEKACIRMMNEDPSLVKELEYEEPHE